MNICKKIIKRKKKKKNKKEVDWIFLSENGYKIRVG